MDKKAMTLTTMAPIILRLALAPLDAASTILRSGLKEKKKNLKEYVCPAGA